MKNSVRVVIAGRVQGVWYRGWAKSTAASLGLDGWVRNRRDGTVEAVFSGDSATLEAMLQACWQGPDMASVTAVDQFECDVSVNPGFIVKSTF